MAHFSEYKRKDGTTAYRVRVVTGYQQTGKPIQESRTFATKTEAKRAAKAWETEIAQGMTGTTGKTTLGEYLSEWLHRKSRSARPITVTNYAWLINHTIADTPLAGTMLSKVTPGQVQRWIDGLPRAATARKARTVLSIALNEATRLGHIALNPVSRTTAPSHVPREGKAWTSDEVHRFLAIANRDIYAPYWHLACYLGMRPSEIAGLKWASVDLDAGTVRVERARPTVCGKTFESEYTKSPAGTRTLYLSESLVQRLRAHRAHQQTMQTVANAQWIDSGLVCTTEVGTPIDHRNTQRRFQHLCQQAGVSRIRVYDLRHTATSLMIDAGADIKAASEALGHSDPSITMKVYRHVQSGQRAQALALLAQAITLPEEDLTPSTDDLAKILQKYPTRRPKEITASGISHVHHELGGQESNLQPSDPKSVALPLRHRPSHPHYNKPLAVSN